MVVSTVLSWLNASYDHQALEVSIQPYLFYVMYISQRFAISLLFLFFLNYFLKIMATFVPSANLLSHFFVDSDSY